MVAFGRLRTRFLLAFVMLAFGAPAFAQGGASELTGLITDPTGAVIAGATVKLTNNATGEVRTSATSPSGTYRFPALPVVESYTLDVSAKGFKGIKVQDIVPAVGLVITRDVKLELGAESTQVTVEAGQQLVQTEDSSLGGEVNRRVWQDMPLEDRSQNQFIALLPGAEPALNSGAGTVMGGTDRGASVNGTRSGTGNFLVEGFSNNDQGLGGAGTVGTGPGGANTTISPDAIQEYRVIDGTPSAEYGQAGGFVTDTVLKSGTNQWHGSLFEYNRIQALAANSFFSNQAGVEDHLVRNQFGGSVGGPIIKDKTFFYFTVEAQRLRFSNPLAVTTTTPDFANFVNDGGFASFMESGTPSNSTPTGGICYFLTGTTCPGAFSTGTGYPNTSLGAIYQKMFASEPIPYCAAGAANCTGLSNVGAGLYTAGLMYPVNVYGTVNVSQPSIVNQMRYSVKIDHKLSSNDQLTGAYLYDNADSVTDYGGNFVFGPNLINPARAQNAGLTWSHTFSPTVLNQARFDYVRNTSNFPIDPAVASMPSTLDAFDSINFSFGMSSALPQFFTENEFVWKDDLSITKGQHNFKTGFEFRRTRNGSSFEAWKYGYNIDNDIEDLLTDATFTNNLENVLDGHSVFGSMYGSEASLNPTTGGLPVYYRGYRANEVGTYVQDDWRVRPRLTVNLGVRWEYFGPPHNYQAGIDGNFYTGSPILQTNPGNNPFWLPSTNPYYASFATGVVQQRNHDLWNKDLTNFGPRIGFAYDLLGTQKLVLRGGFGINYDRMFNNIFENIRFNPPFFATGELGHFLTGAGPITNAEAATLVSYPFNGRSVFFGQPLTPTLRAMDQNLDTAYYEQAHLGVQYQLGKDFVLESNYVGTFGHKLIGVVGRNNYDGQFASGLDSSPINPLYGSIGFRTNCCDSNYHGWQTTLRKRFSGGLQFNANYTFAKAMDDLSDAFTTKNASVNGYPTDSQDPHLDYGPADYDVRHRVVASFVYDLPFAKSSRWLGGWNVSGVVTWQSGTPFSITDSGIDSNADGQFNDRANYLGPGKITNAVNHSVSPATGYLNTGASNWGMLNGTTTTATVTALPCPTSVNMGLWCQGTALGQMERNTLVGPGFFDTDFGVKKSFKITESSAFRIEANFFNLFNHTNFLYPQPNLSAPNFGASFATFTNQQPGGPRVTQLAARFDF